MKHKLRLYFDTSIISHLDAQDSPDKEADTKKLWTKVQSGAYDIVLSNAVFFEIGKCKEPKRSFMMEMIAGIEYRYVEIDERGVEIANRFVDLGILKQKNFDDCQHIAAAILSESDIIVSWNFKHIVNHKTMMGVKAVTALEGYDDLLIYTPTILVEEEE